MCIVGCAPKEALYDFLESLKDDLIDLDNLSNQKYNVQQLKLSMNLIMEKINPIIKDKINITDEKESLAEIIDPYIKEIIKEIKFFMNDYLYQGCIIYSKGTVRSKQEKELWDTIMTIIDSAIYNGREDIKMYPEDTFPASLRPTDLKIIKIGEKDDIDIRLLFVSSHNNFIKSYLYSRTDWIHVINPKLSLKYLKQNRDLKHEDLREGVKILYIDHEEEIDEEFRRKLIELEDEKDPLCILCNNDKVFDRITFLLETIKPKREWAVQKSWI
jgi:hypothetical protein